MKKSAKTLLSITIFVLSLYVISSKLKKTYYKSKLENNPHTFDHFYIRTDIKSQIKQKTNTDWLGINNNDLELETTISKFKKFIETQNSNELNSLEESFKPINIIINHQELNNILNIEYKSDVHNTNKSISNLIVKDNLCHYTINYKLNFSEYYSYMTNHLIVKSLNNEQSNTNDLISQNHCLILKSSKFSFKRKNEDLILCSDNLVYFIDFLSFITIKMYSCKSQFFKAIKQEKIFKSSIKQQQENDVLNILNQLNIGSFKAYIVKIYSEDKPSFSEMIFGKINVNSSKLQLIDKTTDYNDNSNNSLLTSWNINNIILAHYIKTDINLYKQIIIEYEDLEIAFKDVVIESESSNCFGFYYLIKEELINNYLLGNQIKEKDIPLYALCFPSKLECDHTRKIIKYAVILYHFISQEKQILNNSIINYYRIIEKDISEFNEQLLKSNLDKTKESIFRDISKLKSDLIKQNNSKINKDYILKLYWEFHKCWIKNDFDALVRIANKIHTTNLSLSNYGLIE